MYVKYSTILNNKSFFNFFSEHLVNTAVKFVSFKLNFEGYIYISGHNERLNLALYITDASRV